jgi:hypothetical protein
MRYALSCWVARERLLGKFTRVLKTLLYFSSECRIMLDLAGYAIVSKYAQCFRALTDFTRSEEVLHSKLAETRSSITKARKVMSPKSLDPWCTNSISPLAARTMNRADANPLFKTFLPCLRASYCFLDFLFQSYKERFATDSLTKLLDYILIRTSKTAGAIASKNGRHAALPIS